jgi:putative flippase GtrA
MTPAARLVRFGGVGLGGVAVQLAAIALLVDGLEIHYAWATPVAVAAALVHNFLWHRRWTWRDRNISRSTVANFGAFVAANGVVSLAGNAVAMVLLVGHFGLPAVPANVAAIIACSLLNFTLADRVVFAGDRRLLS